MAKPLNVTHVVLSLDVGGLERNVVNQVREGSALGQRVSVLCMDRPGTLAPQAHEHGARVVSLSRRPGIHLGIVPQIRSVLRELKPDVVHTHQLGSLFYGGAAARLSRVPLVVHTEHGKEPYAQRLRTRVLGRVAGRFAHRFYCLTSDIAAAVVANGVARHHRVAVILNGIDTEHFSRRYDTAPIRAALNIPPDAPVIGTVGRLNEIKRQDLLLQAFARLQRRIGSAHLLIVGDGPLRQELEGLARALRIEQAVHFAGYQPSSAPYLQCMHAFALTSRSEGTPQAVLEASITGLPVIATRVGGLPEVIDDGQTGILVEFGNTDLLADGLYRVLSDRKLANRLGTAARRRVESRFAVRRMAGEYHRDFLELLGRQTVDPRPLLTPSCSGRGLG